MSKDRHTDADKKDAMSKDELALEKKRLELEAKKLEAAALDKARDDKRAFVKTVFMGVATIMSLLLIGFALYWNRAFVFKGWGFEATTGSHAHQVPPTSE
jgi:hypothetical protein